MFRSSIRTALSEIPSKVVVLLQLLQQETFADGWLIS
jgi:hypothetical protein